MNLQAPSVATVSESWDAEVCARLPRRRAVLGGVHAGPGSGLSARGGGRSGHGGQCFGTALAEGRLVEVTFFRLRFNERFTLDL